MEGLILALNTRWSIDGRVDTSSEYFNTPYMCVSCSKWWVVIIWFKATFSAHKLVLKNAQTTTLYTNWSLYITFTMIYYIRQE